MLPGPDPLPLDKPVLSSGQVLESLGICRGRRYGIASPVHFAGVERLHGLTDHSQVRGGHFAEFSRRVGGDFLRSLLIQGYCLDAFPGTARREGLSPSRRGEMTFVWLAEIVREVVGEEM